MKPITVTNLNEYINNLLKKDFILNSIAVIGTIGNLRGSKVGIFFNLSDDTSRISCFVNRNLENSLKEYLKEGDEVIVFGKISLFKSSGSINLIVEDVKVNGLSSLKANFDKIKQKLEQEGIFSKEHKKQLPINPKKIAIITSKEGAVIHDMTSIMASKNPFVEIMLKDVKVQGRDASKEIINAFNEIQKESWADLIILARGGGADEDFIPFNDEELIYTMFNIKIPIITGIGHETNFTLADFVADVRAETPTSAMNIALLDVNQKLLEIKKILDNSSKTIEYTFRDMMGILNQSHTKLIKSKISIGHSFTRMEDILKNILNTLGNSKKSMEVTFNQMSYNIDNIKNTLKNSKSKIDMSLKAMEYQLSLEGEKLQGVNPKNVISKGYGAILNLDGSMITKTKDIEIDKDLRIIMADGEIIVKVKEVKND